jgi:hypothetical protein
VVFKIALRTLDDNSRINDQFGRFEFSVVKKGNNYVLPFPILAYGNIGVEVLAHDKMENTRFRYGINYIDMLVDSQVVFKQSIDKVDLSESRRILTLMDYRTLELKGARYNKLYIDDGNHLDYYTPVTKKNGIRIKNNNIPVEIRLRDYNENVSHVYFTLKPSPQVVETPLLSASGKPFDMELHENIMKVSVKLCSADEKPFVIWQQGKSITANYAYRGSNQQVYLINLATTLPDSIHTCQGTITLNFKDRIPSDSEYKYYSDLADIEFPNQALYDTAFLSVDYDTLSNLESFRLGNRTIPLHKNITVTLKPKLNYFQSRDLGLYRKEGRGFVFVPSEWKNNRVTFNTREFGEFTLLRDTIPPTITNVGISTAAARVRIKDNLSGIAYYEANINGQWLLMVYDYKNGILKSEKLDNSKLLQGDFELKVVDQAGNETIYKQKI